MLKHLKLSYMFTGVHHSQELAEEPEKGTGYRRSLIASTQTPALQYQSVALMDFQPSSGSQESQEHKTRHLGLGKVTVRQ